MRELTPRQRKVLNLIEQEKAKTGFEPSSSLLARKLKINPNGVTGHLKALEKKGYLKRNAVRRGILQLTQDLGLASEDGFEIPLLGDIPAGMPQEAIESSDEKLSLARTSFGPAVFALRVSGQSMTGDGILPGDHVLISTAERDYHRQSIFAVRIDNTEVTLKRLERPKGEPHLLHLIPSNKDFAVKTVPAKEVEIIGKMVGLVRRV